MISRSRFLVAPAIVAAAFCWSNSAHAEHTGFYIIAGNVVGQAALVPAYGSIGYYAYNSTKCMHSGWVIANVATSLAVGGIGGYFTVMASDEISFLAIGIPHVVSSGFVIGATAWQRSRPAESLPAMILPYASSTVRTGTTVGITAVGTF